MEELARNPYGTLGCVGGMAFFDAGFVPSESILAFKVKALKTSRAAKTEAEAEEVNLAAAEDTKTAQPFIDLYNTHDGDLVAIFAALGDHPGEYYRC